MVISKRMISEFKKCIDNFDYFKYEYARNNSYIGAHFAYDLIFKKNINDMVMMSPNSRLIKLRTEIIDIIDNFDSLFDGGHSTIRYETGYKMISNANSKLHLCCSRDINCTRGMTISKMYYDGPDNVLSFSPWMKTTDIPNLFETTL